MLDLSHLCGMEAEQALLGAVLIRPQLLASMGALVAADFYEPLHGEIFAAAGKLHGEGRPVTPVTLAPFFLNAEPVGDLSVAQYLGRLLASATTTINAPEYAKIVADFSARRALATAADKLKQLAGDHGSSVAQIASEAVSDLDVILSGARALRPSYATGGAWAAELVEDLLNGSGAPPVPSGFADLDRAIGGFRRGEQHLIAARPSIGKTAMGVQLMLNAAKAGYPVHVFSLEMGAKQGIMSRCLSSYLFSRMSGAVPYVDILRHLAAPERGILGDAELNRLTDAAADFSKLPFDIDDQPNLTVAEISSRVRQRSGRLKYAKHDTALVIVDHMGRVKPSGRYSGNKTAEVGEISGSLAAMAKNLDVALMTLCQLNRGAEALENKRPGLANLRDSGEIEQDADLVLFLFRASYYLERARENNVDAEEDRKVALENCRHDFEVIIGKQRSGPCITVDLWADMANNAIRNMQKR